MAIFNSYVKLPEGIPFGDFFLDFCVEEAGLENHSEVQVVPVSEADGDFTIGDQRIRHLQNGSP